MNAFGVTGWTRRELPHWRGGACGRPGGAMWVGLARGCGWGLLGVLVVLVSGCGPSSILARALLVAPNRVPEFAKPTAPVLLRWPSGMMDRFPSGTNWVGDPEVGIRWRLIEPADYGLAITQSNRVVGSRTNHEFSFRFRLPHDGLPRRRPSLGTAFLLHGYGVDGDALFPWGLYLAEAGWTSVLVDLRGHGGSGGRRVGFGVWETNDLRCLRESLQTAGWIRPPYVAVGHSFGASLAVRWQVVDPGIRASVAMGAYARFERAVVRLRDGYAPWVPRPWVRGAARRLPDLLGVEPWALDTEAVIRGQGVRALFVAGWGDVVTPPEDSSDLRGLAGVGSGFLIVAPASHEMLPYLFSEHGPMVVRWLATEGGDRNVAGRTDGSDEAGEVAPP